MNNIVQEIEKVLLFINIRDVFDIIIIALSAYLILIFIKQTRSFFILGSFLMLFVLNFISQRFDLSLTRQLFEPLLTFFIAVFVIVFQPEIRKFFKWLSSGRTVSFKKALSLPENNIQTIVRAVFEMARIKMGAILVLPGEYPLDDIIEGGFPLNGKISFPLILSIFDSSSPGHDGAILIEGSEIKMFGLHLPLAQEFKEYNRVGTRHRAGAGITEKTDAMSIIVSEERGEVSVSTKGKLQKVKTPEELANIIAEFTKQEEKVESKPHGILHFIFIRNTLLKIISVLISISLWVFFVYGANTVKINYEIPIQFKSLDNNLTIKSTNPEKVTITISGNKTDVSRLKPEDINIIVNAQNFRLGDNYLTISKDNIQTPSYIELTGFSNKNIQVRTIEKTD